jgi:hypothetical protein
MIPLEPGRKADTLGCYSCPRIASSFESTYYLRDFNVPFCHVFWCFDNFWTHCHVKNRLSLTKTYCSWKTLRRLHGSIRQWCIHQHHAVTILSQVTPPMVRPYMDRAHEAPPTMFIEQICMPTTRPVCWRLEPGFPSHPSNYGYESK